MHYVIMSVLKRIYECVYVCVMLSGGGERPTLNVVFTNSNRQILQSMPLNLYVMVFFVSHSMMEDPTATNRAMLPSLGQKV